MPIINGIPICVRCETELTDDNWTKNNRKKRNYTCQDCRHLYSLEYYQKNREKRLAYSKEYYKNHPEMHYTKPPTEEQRLRYNAKNRKSRRKIRLEALLHYSNGTMKCKKCGFDDERALSLDHINGGGCKHRREIGAGAGLSGYLKRHGYPEGLQVLCMNCQFIKKRERKEY